MSNEKGISAWTVLVILALLIGAGFLWSKYFAEPTAEVMMQGAQQAKPAIEKAHQASNAVSRASGLAADAAKKMDENTQQHE